MNAEMRQQNQFAELCEFICFAGIDPSCISKKERKLNRKSRTKAVKKIERQWIGNSQCAFICDSSNLFFFCDDACWSWISLAIDFLTVANFCDLCARLIKYLIFRFTRCLDTLIITKYLSVTVDNNFWQVLQERIKCGKRNTRKCYQSRWKSRFIFYDMKIMIAFNRAKEEN